MPTRWFFLVFLPLAVGGLVYLACGRPTLLLAVALRAAVGPGPQAALAALVAPLSPPTWVAWSLPDGLWAFAGVAAQRLVARAGPAPSGRWLVLTGLTGPASELAQAAHLLPGVYDPRDLVAYGLGAALALPLTRSSR